MKNKINPQQSNLFDLDCRHYGRVAYRRLKEGWQAVFRETLLHLMPADELGKGNSEDTGRKTKELYSMAGLMVLAEMRDWTSLEAADAYMFDQGVQFALNLGHHNIDMTSRTVERYQKKFREQDLAQLVFERVTKALAETLELEVDRQRLDSTHLFSDMARFTRTKLMQVAITRFLTQLKRHHNAEYYRLDAAFRDRCCERKKSGFGRGPGDGLSYQERRQQAAKDLLLLIERYAGVPKISEMNTYKDMVRVFEEQCEVVGDQITIRKHTGSRTMQNPSDPDATYDGHKGPGYQIQLSETCNPENRVQLITCALPETAAAEDGDALPTVVKQLESMNLKPEELLADTLYGSDDNQQLCESFGIDLIAPVRGPAPRKTPGIPTEKQQRLARRRAEESTEEWQARYRARSAIEGTNSGLKRRMGLGRLRVRGRSSVRNVLLLKVTGWNILRAVEGLALKTKKACGSKKKRLKKPSF
ncbi:MAG: transposase, partial [Kiritimatiellae bacterium]|nr:transposase [Kiritimatiellia bacterium]